MITVIIAHRNYNEYLPQAIMSCIFQTIPVNYVVIDDCSDTPPNPPKCPYIEREGCRIYQDGNAKYIYLNKNVGPSMARNIGIIESWETSDYFQMLDADDYMMDNKCETLLKQFDDNTGIVYADYIIEAENTRRMEFKIPYSQDEFNRHCIVHSGSMVSKKALEKVIENNAFYDNQMRCCEDYDLFLRISEKMMVKHVPEFLTVVRDHSLNSTNTVPSQIWHQCMQRLHQKRAQRNAKY